MAFYVCIATSDLLFANERVFGENRKPVLLDEIPQGNFREEVGRLSLDARDKALIDLARHRIPIADLDSIHADQNGKLYYACEAMPLTGASASASASGSVAAQAGGVPISTPPVLHSRSGATNILYLDFNGMDVTGTAWNTANNQSLYKCTPYDLDGDPTTFNSQESEVITNTWKHVSEFFRPFGIDVTTEEPTPASFAGNRVARALITKNQDANGINNPSYTSGGVAYVGVFGSASYFNTYSPAFVYYNQVGNSNAVYLAMVVAHEIGHNLGLSHDGTSTLVYYPGHGNGYLSWGPIMGAPYGMDEIQWCKGDYYGANNQQDDLAIISGSLSYTSDDHGDSISTATALLRTNVSGTYRWNSSGTISKNTDADFFKFGLTKRTVNIRIAPLLNTNSPLGASLKTGLDLYNANGDLLVSVNDGLTADVNTNITLRTGEYYLKVYGAGCGYPVSNPPSGFTSYGSLGSYTVSIGPPVPPPILQQWGSTPAPIPVIATNNGVSAISLGAGNAWSSSCLTKNGQVVVWGSGPTLNVPQVATNGVTAISLGYDHLLALKSGAVIAWGDGTSGDTQVPAVAQFSNSISAVSAGWWSSLALTTNGSIIAWGNKYSISSSAYNNPAVVINAYNAAGTKFIGISDGYNQGMALTDKGKVIAFGTSFTNNRDAQSDVPISASADVVAISEGRDFALALKNNGTVIAWGDNSLGQCNVPAGLKDVVAIAAGGFHAVALTVGGEVVTWGNGTTNSSLGKVPPADGYIVAVEAGRYHSMSSTQGVGDSQSSGGLQKGSGTNGRRVTATPRQLVSGPGRNPTAAPSARSSSSTPPAGRQIAVPRVGVTR
jgi:hypothetical protein